MDTFGGGGGGGGQKSIKMPSRLNPLLDGTRAQATAGNDNFQLELRCRWHTIAYSRAHCFVPLMLGEILSCKMD